MYSINNRPCKPVVKGSIAGISIRPHVTSRLIIHTPGPHVALIIVGHKCKIYNVHLSVTSHINCIVARCPEQRCLFQGMCLLIR